MDDQNLEQVIFTGLTDKEFELAKKSKTGRRCYICKHTHGDQVVSLIDGKYKGIAEINVDPVILHETEVRSFRIPICGECAAVMAWFIENRIRKILQEMNIPGLGGFNNRIHFD